jgi:hypothetical protein
VYVTILMSLLFPGVREDVERLGHPKFRVREAASASLVARGQGAVLPLWYFASASGDLTVRRQADLVAERIRDARLRAFLPLPDLRAAWYDVGARRHAGWALVVSPYGGYYGGHCEYVMVKPPDIREAVYARFQALGHYQHRPYRPAYVGGELYQSDAMTLVLDAMDCCVPDRLTARFLADTRACEKAYLAHERERSFRDTLRDARLWSSNFFLRLNPTYQGDE